MKVWTIEIRNPAGEDVARVRCDFTMGKTLSKIHEIDGEAEVIALTLEAIRQILVKCAKA